MPSGLSIEETADQKDLERRLLAGQGRASKTLHIVVIYSFADKRSLHLEMQEFCTGFILKFRTKFDKLFWLITENSKALL